MANALLLGQAANIADAADPNAYTRASAVGQQMALQRQQMQQNALNQQYVAQDRQRQLAQQQQAQQQEAAREAVAGYYMTPPDQRGAYYQQVAPKFGLDPNADHAQMVGGLIKNNPGLLGPEVTAKVIEREFGPAKYGQPVAAVDKTGKPAFVRFPENGGAPQQVQDFAPPPKDKGVAGIDSGAAAGPYDPATIKTAAMVVASDPMRMRDYASFGNSGQAARVQINQAITKLKQDTGMSDADFIKARVNAHAAVGSAQKMIAQQNNIQAYEGLAKANGQRLLDLFSKVDDTGVPVIEGLTRAAKRAGGNVDAAELQSVLTTYQTEVARILGNPNMTGVISDTARHEVQQMASGKMSVAQAKRVINRINVEMDLRNQFLGEQIDKAGSAAVVGGTPAPAAAQSTSGGIPDGWSVQAH